MDVEYKKIQVSKWLLDVYGNEKAPNIPEESLDQLYNVMQLSLKEEKSLQVISDFQKCQIAEYKDEINKMRQRMEMLGITSKSRRGEDLDNVAIDLAQSAELLGLDDPSNFSLDLAIADLRKKSAHIPLDTYLKKVKSVQDKRALLEDHSLLNKTDQALNMAKTEAKIDEDTIAQIRKKHHFMQEKEKEYMKLQEKYIATIRKSGYNKATSHDAILAMKKKLDKVEDQMKPIQNKLEAYKGLPASLELATAELSEKQQALDKLKGRLQNELQKIEL